MHKAYGWAALTFIATAISLQWWPALPVISAPVIVLLVSLSVLIWCTRVRLNYTVLALLIGLILGTAWMASVGHRYQSWQLPEHKIKQNVTIQARVIAVKHGDTHQRLFLNVETLGSHPNAFRAIVNWYHAEQYFAAGQFISLCVKLIPARGRQNPGEFDYWRWLVSQGVQATGYVVNCTNNRLLRPSLTWFSRISYRIERYLHQPGKWLMAILLADRSQLSREDWTLLQRTGVAHLFTLSGLHMGMVFLFCLVASKPIVFLISTLLQLGNCQHALPMSYCLALLVSWCFVALCGFPVPLLRAAVALSMYSLLRVSNAFASSRIVLIWVVLLCVLIDPLTVMGISLYLSCCAVIVLLFLLWRLPSPGAKWHHKLIFALKLQLLLGSFMGLISAAAFNNIYWLSLLINLIAIPFVSLIVVPLGCVTLVLLVILPAYSGGLLNQLASLLNGFMTMLQLIPSLSWTVYLDNLLWVAALLVIAFFMLPAISWRVKTSVFILCAWSLVPSRENEQTWSLHVFDVGQGSAFLVRSGDNGLIIDTGPGFAGHTAAQSTLYPALKTLNMATGLRGIITHFDNDHAAGQQWLSKQGVVKHWLTPNNGCEAGKGFRLGLLTVEVVWPIPSIPLPPGTQSKNNLSCVIRVTDGKHSVLFSGDIERQAEKVMLNQGVNLASSILIAPHHGSNSSSTYPWVSAVSPDYVVFTTGPYNRWGFPHPDVLRRYKNFGASLLDTAEDGYIRFTINQNESQFEVETWRSHFAPRWYKSR